VVRLLLVDSKRFVEGGCVDCFGIGGVAGGNGSGLCYLGYCFGYLVYFGGIHVVVVDVCYECHLLDHGDDHDDGGHSLKRDGKGRKRNDKLNFVGFFFN